MKTLEQAKVYIGKKVRPIDSETFITLKEIKELKNMLLCYFEENPYVCNMEILRDENKKSIWEND